jgi:hypothetical protein
MLVNAIEWSRSMTSTPVPVIARVGVMGDLVGRSGPQIAGYLSGLGYTVTSYPGNDYTAITADVNNLQLDVVVLNAVSNLSGFNALMSAADSTNCGVLFLAPQNGSGSVAGSGLGVLSAQTSDPQSVTAGSGDGAVKFTVNSTSFFMAGFTQNKKVTVVNDGKSKDHSAFALATGTSYTVAGTSAMTVTGTMVAYRDRGMGTSRRVLLGPLGVSTRTSLGHWTQSGKDLLVAALEWARAGAP